MSSTIGFRQSRAMAMVLGLAAALLTACVHSTPSPQGGAASEGTPLRKDVGVDEFDRLRRERGYVILDVRTAQEFAAGHIQGAVNIDVNAPDFVQRVSENFRPDQHLLVQCRSGSRSVRACDKLEQAGFINLYNLEGGIRAWEASGRPVASRPAGGE